MGSISNSDAGKIEAISAYAFEPTKLQVSVEGTPRLTLSETTSTITTSLVVSGNLNVTGNVTAPNLQPVLTSVSDGGVFHTVLGAGECCK